MKKGWRKEEQEIPFEKEGLWAIENYFRYKNIENFLAFILFLYVEGVLSTCSRHVVDM